MLTLLFIRYSLYFFEKYLFNVYYYFACVYVSVLVSVEDRRGHWTPWDLISKGSDHDEGAGN